ncbi:MAG TPA: glutamyl-tRNA reductase, partial [Abditibacteriaceae bacterium]
MQLFLLGLNHKTAPVEVREQLSLSSSRLPLALRGLRDQGGAREVAILSTCNRAEIYAVGAADAGPRIEQFLSEFHHLPQRGLQTHLYRHSNAESARHLFRVASGIDSLVLGESQILGQVKTAFEEARANGAISNVLDELFRRAISCGKRARAETDIGRGALSVGSAAVELARQIFGPLQGHTVLILGAGKMSALTAQHLVASGARRVIVSNRTHERACELAQTFGDAAPDGKVDAEAVHWNEFPKRLVEADIVIASTRAPH